MAGETEARNLLVDEAEEGSISREARDARGWIWDYKEAEEGEEAWVREALRQGLEDVLVKRTERMQQTQKATLVSLWEARKTLGESMSIKLPQVIVEAPKDRKLWSTIRTETNSTTKSPTSE